MPSVGLARARVRRSSPFIWLRGLLLCRGCLFVSTSAPQFVDRGRGPLRLDYGRRPHASALRGRPMWATATAARRGRAGRCGEGEEWLAAWGSAPRRLAGGHRSDVGAAPPSSSVPACKGKARMAAEGVPCGICLTDSRRAIRGELDCCAHHFCFVCIMAWARIETRCPFCKARFRTIRRPPVPGRLPAERIVTVAQRIQESRPALEEAARAR